MSKQPHKHAALIKAWADGAEIQVSYDEGKRWSDVLQESPRWDGPLYRIKPKPLVKKYRFVYRTAGGTERISTHHYKDIGELMLITGCALSLPWYQRIDATMIEVEEEN
jgi:hypothetical protein